MGSVFILLWIFGIDFMKFVLSPYFTKPSTKFGLIELLIDF